MGEASAHTDRDAARDILAGKVGFLTQSGSPHDGTPNNSNNQLSAGDEPVGVDHVGCLLVEDIVEGVASVPSNHKECKLGSGRRTLGVRHVEIFLFEISDQLRFGQSDSIFTRAFGVFEGDIN
mmetsp:Transcript_33783/g.79634  ORF Transcript_33783/g.79634 Transcript_33783/m.79634 type:complete len:123 (-) Transcript_33783:5-373(-)